MIFHKFSPNLFRKFKWDEKRRKLSKHRDDKSWSMEKTLSHSMENKSNLGIWIRTEPQSIFFSLLVPAKGRVSEASFTGDLGKAVIETVRRNCKTSKDGNFTRRKKCFRFTQRWILHVLLLKFFEMFFSKLHSPRARDFWDFFFEKAKWKIILLLLNFLESLSALWFFRKWRIVPFRFGRDLMLEIWFL